ncbi:MAG: hypothetical protein ACLTYN_01970 [Dysosmobacter welbionis]
MAHVQAAYFTERDIAEKQRDSFYNPADPWDNGDISFTGGIQPLMVNALTDEGLPASTTGSAGRCGGGADRSEKQSSPYPSITITLNRHRTRTWDVCQGCSSRPCRHCPGGSQRWPECGKREWPYRGALPDAESTALRFNFAVGQAPSW